MILKEFIDEELGHVSYIIGDEISNKSLIIDPKRDIDDYVEFLEQHNLMLKYVINTHPHADFIAGHKELKYRYPNIKLGFHYKTPAKYDFVPLKEKDVIYLGNINLKILETPGHTPYCISLLAEEDNIYKYIFTGDFLFVGDIGRPDLLGEKEKEELINLSYKSAKKIINLDESIIILTAHINGSFCGKNLKKNYFSSIGIEKKTNKALKLINNENKYKTYLKKLDITKPNFFNKMAKINLEGPILVEELPEIKKLNYKELINQFDFNKNYIIDFREPDKFLKSHILGSINVYEKSNILLILGNLIDIETPLFLVGDEQTNFKNIIKRLRRIGFDDIKGIVDDDLNELQLEPFEMSGKVTKIIDLDEMVEKVDIKTDITKIKNMIHNLNLDVKYKVICKNGYKSIAVESFIKNHILKGK